MCQIVDYSGHYCACIWLDPDGIKWVQFHYLIGCVEENYGPQSGGNCSITLHGSSVNNTKASSQTPLGPSVVDDCGCVLDYKGTRRLHHPEAADVAPESSTK